MPPVVAGGLQAQTCGCPGRPSSSAGYGAIVEQSLLITLPKFVVMKQPVQFFKWRPFLVMFFLSLFSLVIWGQEEGGGESTTTTTTKSTKISISENAGGDWYQSPWVWVVGAAVFVLLLVALLSNRGRDTVRTTERVERDRTTHS